MALLFALLVHRHVPDEPREEAGLLRLHRSLDEFPEGNPVTRWAFACIIYEEVIVGAVRNSYRHSSLPLEPCRELGELLGRALDALDGLVLHVLVADVHDAAVVHVARLLVDLTRDVEITHPEMR